MNIIQETDVLATEKLAAVYEELKGAVLRAVRENQPIHEVEKAIWEQLLRLGRQTLAQGFSLLGGGDMGETGGLPDGPCCHRLEQEDSPRDASNLRVVVVFHSVCG